MNHKYISDNFRRSGDFPKSYENLSPNDLYNVIKQNPYLVNKIDEQTGQTLLLRAVETNNLEKAIIIIQSGANINNQNPSGETPLYIAVDNGNFKLIQIL